MFTTNGTIAAHNNTLNATSPKDTYCNISQGLDLDFMNQTLKLCSSQ